MVGKCSDPIAWRSRFRCAEPGYRASALHAAEMDRELGFGIGPIEDFLRDRASGAFEGPRRLVDVQDWVGLNPQALLTPYSELLEIIERVGARAGETWVDLGAGYGRLGILLGLAFPGVRCSQFELVPERVEEGLRVMALQGLGPERGIELVPRDLTAADFVLPEAEVYFIYDYGSRTAIERTLADLRRIAARRPVIVVGRGRGVRHQIETAEPWLSQVVAPEHASTYSVYRSA